MDWKSHAVLGALLALGIFYVFLGEHSILVLAEIAIFAGLSALIPDLDHESSKGKKILDMAILLLGALVFLSSMDNLRSALMLSLSLVGMYAVVFMVLKPRHRGITHSLLFAFAYGIIIYMMFGFNLAVAGLVGYLSHLVADGTVKLV